MSLIDQQSVLDHTPLEDLDKAKLVLPYGPQARAELRRVLTRPVTEYTGFGVPSERYPYYKPSRGDLYDDIVDYANQSEFDEDDYDQLVQAETLWAWALALPHLGLKMARDGGFVRGTGFEQSRTDYKGASELGRFATQFKNQAMALAKDLIPDGTRRTTYVL